MLGDDGASMDHFSGPARVSRYARAGSLAITGERFVKVKMVCLEDGITSCGFRKMAAYVARLNADTEALLRHHQPLPGDPQRAVRGLGSGGGLGDDEIDEIAQGLIGADLVGFSSMTGYADLTHRISAACASSTRRST